MDLRGAVLLDQPSRRKGISKLALAYGPSIIGFDKKGRPIYEMAGGGLQAWQETLVAGQVDGSALSNSTTATSIIPSAAKVTLPAAPFWAIGKSLRFTLRGRLSNIVTTPGNLTLDIRFGAVVVFNGGAVALNTTAKTNVTFEFEAILTCRAIGSGTGANMIGIGSLASESMVGSAANTALSAMLPLSAPAPGTGFDSTAAQTVDVFATFSVANSGNSIQAHEYILELLN